MLSKLIIEKGFKGARKNLAAELGVTAGLLSHYETGNHAPRLDVLIRLANLLEVSLDVLVFGDHMSTPQPSQDPLYRYIDRALAGYSSKVDLQIQMMARIASVIGGSINEAAKTAALHSPGRAGLLSDEETLQLESYSLETRVLSMNLQYDIIKPAEDQPEAAGRFMDVVAQNLALGRSYQFLLPQQMRDDWWSVVDSYRSLLFQRCRDTARVRDLCHFRCTSGAVIVGAGLYRLDIVTLERELPILYQQVLPGVDKDGWVGYIIPASDQLQADCIMDLAHLTNGRSVFENLWRHAKEPQKKPALE
jgi:transcriptional regulator with XRE-family HTH domain